MYYKILVDEAPPENSLRGMELLSMMLFAKIIIIGLHDSVLAQDTLRKRIENEITVMETSYNSYCAGLGYQKGALFEVGFGRYHYTYLRPHFSLLAFSASIEAQLNHSLYVAPKISAWAAGGVGPMELGMNLLYYTNLRKNSLCLRPEIGFGMPELKLCYGYNIVHSSPIVEIGRHSVALVYFFPQPKEMQCCP